MKVFKIIPHSDYCYGCAIVAAETEEDAKKLYLDYDEFNEFLYKDGKCSIHEIKGLKYTGEKEILVDSIQEE